MSQRAECAAMLVDGKDRFNSVRDRLFEAPESFKLVASES